MRQDNIIARCRLTLDFDPRRFGPDGARLKPECSSTDAELSAARGVARAAMTWLMDNGWPVPVAGLSGNGGHLNYALDLPLIEENDRLLAAFHVMMRSAFATEQVEIDTATHNRNRV